MLWLKLLAVACAVEGFVVSNGKKEVRVPLLSHKTTKVELPYATTPEEQLVAVASEQLHEVKKQSIVLISGFEAFNVALYKQCASEASRRDESLRVEVFSDRDLDRDRKNVEKALKEADAVIVSLIFDYDDVEWLRAQLKHVETRLIFESASELMVLNRVGQFSTEKGDGPPWFVKKLFKEEDKFKGYLKLLKIGPPLLKHIPGARDLRTWLELYGLWNEGGDTNVANMLSLLNDRCLRHRDTEAPKIASFPAVGLCYPSKQDSFEFFETPREYLDWYRRKNKKEPTTIMALLLYRKHVATKQPHIGALIRRVEKMGATPLPIFISGVEAHTVVRDWLGSKKQKMKKRKGSVKSMPSSTPSAFL